MAVDDAEAAFEEVVSGLERDFDGVAAWSVDRLGRSLGWGFINSPASA
jgi:hypothetical protein